MTGAVGLLATGIVLELRMDAYTQDELYALEIDDVLRIDRSAARNYSHPAANASDVFLYTSGVMLGTLLIPKETRSDFLIVGTLLLETMLINNGLTTFTKSVGKRPRPLVFNEAVSEEDKLKKSARLSFFSSLFIWRRHKN